MKLNQCIHSKESPALNLFTKKKLKINGLSTYEKIGTSYG